MTIFIGRLPDERDVSDADFRKLLSSAGRCPVGAAPVVHGPGAFGTTMGGPGQAARLGLLRSPQWPGFRHVRQRPRRHAGAAAPARPRAGEQRRWQQQQQQQQQWGWQRQRLACTVGPREKDIVEEAEDAKLMHLQMGPALPPGMGGAGEDGGAKSNINEDEEAGRLVTIEEEINDFVATLLAAQLAGKKEGGSSSSSSSSSSEAWDAPKGPVVWEAAVGSSRCSTPRAWSSRTPSSRSHWRGRGGFRLDQRARDERLDR